MSLIIHEENSKENHNRVGSLYVIKDTRAFICEEVCFFRLIEDKFSDFVRKLAY